MWYRFPLRETTVSPDSKQVLNALPIATAALWVNAIGEGRGVVADEAVRLSQLHFFETARNLADELYSDPPHLIVKQASIDHVQDYSLSVFPLPSLSISTSQ